MPAPSPHFQAVIFDLDGTLVDNMRYHLQSWVELSKQLGIEMTAERFQRELSGRTNSETFEILLGKRLPVDEGNRLAEAKERRYRELYRPHLGLAPGASDLIDRLRRAGTPIAVATAAPRENRTFVLEGLGLRDKLDAVVGAEDVERGKPAPDLFLLAARRLRVDPAQALVFEDAINGIRAAKAAGMAAVGITTATSAAELREAGANWTMPHFSPLPADLLARLF